MTCAEDADLKVMTTTQLRSRARACLKWMRFASRNHHKWIREELLLPILDEYKTRPEAQRYGALSAFLRDLSVMPGTARQWRKRLHSPRPSNGRKRQGNGREKKGGGWNGPERYASEVLPEAIGAALEALAASRIELPPLANGNASLVDRLSRFLGAADKEGHATPAFKSAFRIAEKDTLRQQ